MAQSTEWQVLVVGASCRAIALTLFDESILHVPVGRH